MYLELFLWKSIKIQEQKRDNELKDIYFILHLFRREYWDYKLKSLRFGSSEAGADASLV